MTETNPEDCDHDSDKRMRWRIDAEGLPEKLYWESDCQECGAVVSLEYEPTGSALIGEPETGEYWTEDEFWFYDY